MCGIATISIGRSCRGRIPYPLLRKLASQLLWELEPRGVDASGIAIINEKDKDAPKSVVFKKPLRPSRLIERPRFKEVLQSITPATNFVLLHARAATQGSTKDNFNNHPILTNPILGIHNGTLYNHDKLFEKFEGKFSPEGSVDSEVIFLLFKDYLSQGFSPSQSMQMTAENLDGSFTGAAIDLKKRHQMVMFKFLRPLSIVKIPHYDIVITVSETRYYDNARRYLKIKAKDHVSWAKDGSGLFFDLNLPSKICDNLTPFSLPVDDKIWGNTTTVDARRWLTSGI